MLPSQRKKQTSLSDKAFLSTISIAPERILGPKARFFSVADGFLLVGLLGGRVTIFSPDEYKGKAKQTIISKLPENSFSFSTSNNRSENKVKMVENS